MGKLESILCPIYQIFHEKVQRLGYMTCLLKLIGVTFLELHCADVFLHTTNMNEVTQIRIRCLTMQQLLMLIDIPAPQGNPKQLVNFVQ